MADQFIPRGFILSDAAYYAYQDQDVYPDVLSFCSAIPDNLRPLFVIPVTVDIEPSSGQIASRVASIRTADGSVPTGQTEEGDWFGTKTFTYDDNEPTIPQTSPGSIFDIDGADAMTHHQEYMFDDNIQNPTDTSYMNDVDMTQYWKYPYRTEEKPVRHSSVMSRVMIMRLALKPDELETHTPEKIREKADVCDVKFVSFDKNNRIYTFSVSCNSKSPHTVRASLSDLRHAAVTCDCPFWRWNGPEFHAKKNGYLLGDPHGTASPPDVRDPERKYWLCKHTYAVTTRLDLFVKEVAEENSHLASDEEVLEKVDDSWDKLEGVSQISLDKAEDADDVEVEWEEVEEPEEIEAEAAEAEAEEPEAETEKDTPEIEWEEITDEDIDWGAESEDWEEHTDEDITDEDINWEEKPTVEPEPEEEPESEEEPEPESEDITDEDINWEESEEEEKK